MKESMNDREEGERTESALTSVLRSMDSTARKAHSPRLLRVPHVAATLTITVNNILMVRKLKYHEQKLLKKVDFLNVCFQFVNIQ